MKKQLAEATSSTTTPARIDREAVHRFISEESYWARAAPRETMDGLIERAARNVGLYAPDGAQVGYSRTVDAPDAWPRLPRGRLRARRAPRPTGRRGARALHRRRGPVRRAALDPAHRGRARPVREVRLRAGRAAARARGAARTVFGERQSAASRSATFARAPPIGMRSCSSESRSRTVTVSSSSVCSSIVSPYGVPISSCRR